MFSDHRKQIELTVSLHQVLVDRTIGNKAKALLMVSHNDISAAGISSDQVRALNRCSCRGAADNATAVQDGLDRKQSSCIGVGIHQSPLAATGEPDSRRIRERSGEFGLARRVGITSVENMHLGGSVFPKHRSQFCSIKILTKWRDDIGTRGWNGNDSCISGAGKTQEFLQNS